MTNNGNKTTENETPDVKSDDMDRKSIKNVKVPAFWTQNPKLWFRKLEAQFHSNNVKTNMSKYYAVVSALNCNTIQQLAGLVKKLSARDKYDALKSALVDAYCDSEKRQTQNTINGDRIRRPTTPTKEICW